MRELSKANASAIRQLVNARESVIHRLTCALVKLADGLMIQQVLRAGTSELGSGATRFFVRPLKGPGDLLSLSLTLSLSLSLVQKRPRVQRIV